MAILRRRGQQNGRLIRRYHARLIHRRLINRRYRYLRDRSRLEREILGHYYQMDRLNQWIEKSLKIICILMFLICTLHLMPSFSRLYAFLLKLAVWSNIVAFVSSVLLLIALHRRRGKLNDMIKRAWKRLTQRRPNFSFHLR